MTEANGASTTEPAGLPPTAMGCVLPNYVVTGIQDAIEGANQVYCLFSLSVGEIAEALDKAELSHLAFALRGADRMLSDAMDELYATGRHIPGVKL